LGSTQTVTNVRFWAVAAEDYGIPNPGVYNGSIVWQIYNDNSGVPGTVQYSGTAAPTPVSNHSTSWGQSYQLDFSIGSVPLGSGAYWLALHNGPMTTQSVSHYFWESSSKTGSVVAFAAADPPPPGTWGDWTLYPGGALAFQLYNGNPIPLPGAVWLLGSGLLGLIGLRKKLRR
jgi:hypothetical protein